MATGTFLAYYRVSTAKQGDSGLGLEAQRAAVLAHLNGGDWTLAAEYTEVESGKNNDRPQLAVAFAHAKKIGATVIIAKLDRLARNVAFIATLMEKGAPFLALDCPTASPFMLHIYASVAEEEARKIAQRTRAALAVAKARGVRLGIKGPENAAEGNAARASAAREHAATVASTIAAARAAGAVSLRQIGERLTAAGAETSPGKHGAWSACQVRNVLARLDE